MLTTVEKVVFLQNVDVFDGIPTEQLSYLAAIAEEVFCPAREDMYQLNAPADALYLVLDGEIRLHREGSDISVVRKSEPFGTWALFDDKPRVATATAVTDTRLLRIDRQDFLDLLSDHGQITENVLKTIVGRLRELLDRIGTSLGEADKT